MDDSQAWENRQSIKSQCSPAVSEAAASSPVQLEDTVGVGHGSAVQGEGLGGSGRGREVHKAVSRVAPTTIIRI